MSMESILGYLEPKVFNRIHFVAMTLWTFINLIFFAVFLDLGVAGSRFDFHCDGAKSENDYLQSTIVRGKCFKEYTKQYKQFRISDYVLAMLNVCIILSASCIYSKITRSKVAQLSRGIPSGDQDRQLLDQETPLSTEKKLFIAYISQLSTKIVSGVLFLILQTRSTNPAFNCYLTDGITQPRNSSDDAQTFTFHDCYNRQAKKRNYLMYFAFGANGAFVAGFLFEAIYLISRAYIDRSFMQDSKFLEAHIRLKQYVEPALNKFIELTRDVIIRGTKGPLELQSLFSGDPGDGTTAKHLTLDQIFANHVVIENKETHDFSKNREEQLKVNPRAHSHQESPEDLLNVENKKVLIVGRHGIGKTLYCIKLLRDWALKKIFTATSGAKIHFYVAFLIKFRRFNSADNLSLKELLRRSEYFPLCHINEKLWNHLQKNPEGILILFDGFDEFKHDENIVEAPPTYSKSIEDKKPLQILYQWLVTGKLLKGVSVLTTTRSTALSGLRHLSFDKMYEILGFSPEQVEQYVYKLAGEEEEAGKKLWRHINSNANLLSLCYVPANSFIMCTSLLQVLQCDSSAVTLPSELTKIYKIAVKVFYFKRTEEFCDKHFSREYLKSDELPSMKKKFEKLEGVAFEGIEEGKLIFGGKEVRGMEDSTLFHRLPDRRIDALKHEKQFCFIHLSMQEFFAARYLTNMSETELRNFVSENIKNGKWQLVFQFLAGLMEDKSHLPSEIITDLLPVETEEIESADYNEKWTENDEKRKVTSWPTRDERDLAVTLIKCINENSRMKLEAQRKLKQTNLNLVNFISCHLTAVECSSLVNVINVQQISHLDLSHNNIGPLGCLEICKLLKCRESQLSWLNLTGNQLIAEGAKYLTEAIINNCQLHTLNLSFNKISDIEAQLLAEAIDNNNCQLHKLDLSINNISDTGAKHLAEAINNNCQLRKLDLSVNNISDTGAQHLAEAINNNNNCQLHTLNLSYNHDITNIGKQDSRNLLSNGQSNCKLYF